MAYDDQGFAEVTAIDVLSRQRVRYTVDAARDEGDGGSAKLDEAMVAVERMLRS